MKKLLLLSLLSLLFTACQVKPVQEPETQPEWSSAEGQIKPGPSTGRAVLALIDKARHASTRGDLTTAESQLERGLRIEPRNPTLWHYLAKVKLYQGEYQQAIRMARRSLSFITNQPKLEADNWRLLAHAYQKSGDTTAAEHAMEKARQLAD